MILAIFTPAVWSISIAGTFFLLWLIKGWTWRDYIVMALAYIILLSSAISEWLNKFSAWLLKVIKRIDPESLED